MQNPLPTTRTPAIPLRSCSSPRSGLKSTPASVGAPLPLCSELINEGWFLELLNFSPTHWYHLSYPKRIHQVLAAGGRGAGRRRLHCEGEKERPLPCRIQIKEITSWIAPVAALWGTSMGSPRILASRYIPLRFHVCWPRSLACLPRVSCCSI